MGERFVPESGGKMVRQSSAHEETASDLWRPNQHTPPPLSIKSAKGQNLMAFNAQPSGSGGNPQTPRLILSPQGEAPGLRLTG